MNLKTYQAENMAQALARVRRDLGRDAVILNTRTFKKGGFLGIGGKTVVEITATKNLKVLHPQQKKQLFASNENQANSSDRRNYAYANASKYSNIENDKTTTVDAKQTESIRQELALVKKMVQELLAENRKQQHPTIPEELFSAYLYLINQEVAQELADDIINKIKSNLPADKLSDKEYVRSAIANVVEKMIPAAGAISAGQPGNPKVIALVGPTGVGKTTTIAKLAAHFKLRENKSVGLITIDTYRIAAVDQLRTYASIINVPLRVVLSPDELKQAVNAMSNNHLILIDTAGRSQNDEIKLRELKTFLDSAKPDEIHLVLSTTSSQKNLLTNIKRFSQLDIDRVILTKLDEAVGMGMLLNIMPKLDRAISYITTGQNVPDDIEPSSANKLAKLLVNLERWDDENSQSSELEVIYKEVIDNGN